MRFILILLQSLTIFSTMSHAAPIDGEKAISLVDTTGNTISVGTISFTPSGSGAAYKIDWDLSGFGDFFLSMRPFKCLEGPEKLWCRVPYPYAIKRVISGADLTDLEYDTLFIWKPSGEYGIDLWNGVYYKFSIADDGALVGRLHEIDMNILSVPPEDGNLRPVGEFDIEEGDPDSHWLPILRID